MALSNVADTISLVGFVFTIIITYITFKTQQNVSDLQNKNLLKTRTPEHKKKLAQIDATINMLANDVMQNKHQLHVELETALSEIKHVVKIMPKTFKHRTREFKTHYDHFDKSVSPSANITEDQVANALWGCIGILHGIMNDLENIQENIKKEI